MNLIDTREDGRSRISARVPQKVQELLQDAAELVGSTLNQFVVQAAIEAAEKVIDRDRVMHLSFDGAKLFCELLTNPPPPNQALLNAHQRFRARKELQHGNFASRQDSSQP